MKENPIVLSIITPVFNGKKYLEKCLSNVALQAFPGLEHLIMDGGSSDGGPELVQEWQKKYPHIRLISEKDRGQSDAMNKGINLAKGSIIGFLNVDDFYENDVLPKIPALFEKLPEPSFICGNLNIWNPDGSLKHFNKPDHISLPELLSHRFEWPYNPSAYFYHKSLHELCGFYNESNHYCMDYEFILEAARHTRLQHIDELWGNFCQVEESKTLQRHSNRIEDAAAEGESLRNKGIERLNESERAELNEILKTHTQSLQQFPEKTFLQKLRRFFRF
jgi:glycosyltransferase involved in cell wall biosynthesis